MLTFFVELEAEPLDALLSRSEVLPFLQAGGHALSMGLIDLDAKRARWVRRLEASGVPVTAWLLLDPAEGYWLNADNPERALARWRETAAWAESEGLRLHRVGLDIEFPREESAGAIRSQRRAFFSMLRRRRSRAQVQAAERAYAALVGEVRASGRSVEAYHFPQLLDERRAGTTLLRRALGLVDVAVDAEVFMLYSSYLGRAGARAYFTEAPCIALGVTGGGVNVDNPDATRRFLSWERLAEDLRDARRHTPYVYVFSLEGCVEHDLLGRIAGLDWTQPVPPLSRGEALRARATRALARGLFRAEPLVDRLL